VGSRWDIERAVFGSGLTAPQRAVMLALLSRQMIVDPVNEAGMTWQRNGVP
jgi:hypothetical protein